MIGLHKHITKNNKLSSDSDCKWQLIVAAGIAATIVLIGIIIFFGIVVPRIDKGIQAERDFDAWAAKHHYYTEPQGGSK